MAIILSDFDNIWASSSPLTPYSFTDANYKEGWNFIGSTPPSRQMWDFLQKNNDEKAKYIVDNYLPLSGGTMTGTLTIGTDAKARGLMAQNGTNCFRIASGEFSYASSGAFLHLFSQTADNNAGNFQLSAHDSSNDKSLIGKPDGTLTWVGQTVIVGTEATETFTISSISSGGTANFDLTHTPRYWSYSLTGTGFAEMNVTKNDGVQIWVRNTGSATRTNIKVIINYIY